jgi:hypothetical protein
MMLLHSLLSSQNKIRQSPVRLMNKTIIFQKGASNYSNIRYLPDSFPSSHPQLSVKITDPEVNSYKQIGCFYQQLSVFISPSSLYFMVKDCHTLMWKIHFAALSQVAAQLYFRRRVSESTDKGLPIILNSVAGEIGGICMC